jgi:hypothetical protein
MEFPFSPLQLLQQFGARSDDMWRIKDMNEKLPMLYSIKAMKQL